ncbi:MAG TPA: hypothetical protein VFQ84_12470 [Arenimonas sp.]|uniref:hypothetical protein n=1 Tax=Arenimonas sp. TaxID=1872635 RepID=UPI002D7E41ED|nr:hypothetical protein [Arenimonas sp.]HEU0154147.1 hypothetical protein [Arenimonas sp.]
MNAWPQVVFALALFFFGVMAMFSGKVSVGDEDRTDDGRTLSRVTAKLYGVALCVAGVFAYSSMAHGALLFVVATALAAIFSAGRAD